jgi:DNA-directed RNA polymerase specialized sigma24 family protein
MSETEAVPELFGRLQEGDPQAADVLFSLYAQRLTRVAEQHLSRRLAGRLDGEDIVQSVFRTFFRRSAAGEFKIDGSAQLWRLLVKITVLKARAKGRFHSAAVRDVTVEAADDGNSYLREAVAREPGPEEAAVLVDQIETLLRGLLPFHCHVLEQRLQGHGPSQIAVNLKVSRQTVHRIIALFRQRLERVAGELG